MITENHQTAPRWRLFSHFGFRCTGFPFEILESLRLPETIITVKQIVALEESIKQLQKKLFKEDLPKAVKTEHDGTCRKSVLRTLSATRKKTIGYRIPKPEAIEVINNAGLTELANKLTELANLVTHRNELIEQGRNVFSKEFPIVQKRLSDLVANQRFQEALFISNPNMIHNAQPKYQKSFDLKRRSSMLRKLEKKYMTYLQRFCAKNDTAAFFGPMNTGRFDPSNNDYFRITMPPKRGDKNRTVFISFWAAQAFADTMINDPAIQYYLKPKLNPICQVSDSGNVYFHFLDKNIQLKPSFLSIIHAADGEKTLLSIADILGQPIEIVLKIVKKLDQAKIMITRIMIPSTIFHPLDYLLQWIKDLPNTCLGRGKWLQTLSTMNSLRDKYLHANLGDRGVLLSKMEALFKEVTGIEPTRAAGDTYADRSIIYEECGGDIKELVFGKAFIDDFHRRMKPCLRICQAYGQSLWEHYQDIGRQVVDHCANKNGDLPYSVFVNTLNQLQEKALIEPVGEQSRQFSERLHNLIRQKSTGRLAKLSTADVDSILGIDVFPRKHYHVSPDVLLNAKSIDAVKAGNYQIVMGEFHAFMMPWGSQLYFYPLREEAEQQLANAIEQMSEYANISIMLNVRRHKGLIFESFPGTFIEMFAKSSKSENNGALSISNVTVHHEDGEFRLGERNTNKRYKIYTGGDEKLHLWIFAPPPVLQPSISLGRFTPRVEIEGIVFQRAHWTLPYEDLIPDELPDDSFDKLLEIWRRKSVEQLPDHIFIKTTGEKKPYFIDFNNFFLIEILCDLPRGVGTLEISEMLPNAEDLWLQDEQGKYCSELRVLNLHY